MEPETWAQYLAIAASVFTILVMIGGAVRVVRTAGATISQWAADKWSVIGRVFAIVAVLLVLGAVLGLTATNADLSARVNALENEPRSVGTDFGPPEAMDLERVHQAP